MDSALNHIGIWPGTRLDQVSEALLLTIVCGFVLILGGTGTCHCFFLGLLKILT